jgi:hypothetical protein
MRCIVAVATKILDKEAKENYGILEGYNAGQTKIFLSINTAT